MKKAEQVTLDDLPLFASDRELAAAIVGKDAAEKWLRERLPALASKPGFPPIDPFHGGRPVALVKMFYASYLGIPQTGQGAPDGAEDESSWRGSRRRA